MPIPLLPYPKELTEIGGLFNTKHCTLTVQPGIDRRVLKKAAALKAELDRADNTCHLFLPSAGNLGQIAVCLNPVLKPEAYTLQILPEKIELFGGNAAGCFYGLQTLQQLITLYKGELPTLCISDAPDFAYRGFYHDATRGRVPTVAGLKKIIDRLAALKINSLQLYVEHCFDFKEFENADRTPNDYLTAAELLELDDYCYENFIDFVPSLSTFGHLYELLNLKEYRPLCELQNFKPQKHFWYERMMHHTIDPLDPKSFSLVCSLIDQYLPLFRSSYFNICCDETFDLARGKNAGKDAGRLYCDFVNKLIQYVAQKGKKVMMWGDIALRHREALKNIPQGTLFLNWDYGPNPPQQNVTTVKNSGFQQIVCPGTSAWARLIEKPQTAVPNILKMASYGRQAGALGLLNTNWGDYGHPAPFACSLFGTCVGACAAWNTETVVDADFEQAVSLLVYQTTTNLVPLIFAVSAAQNTATWGQFFNWAQTHSSAEFQSTAEEIKSSVQALELAILTLQGLPGQGKNAILQRLTTATEGILLLNKAALRLKNNQPTAPLKPQAKSFLAAYRSQWLEECKSSELNEIEQFILNIFAS